MARTESQLTSSEIAIIESLVPIGTANQQIRVDAGATGLEYFTPSSASGDMLASTYDPAGIAQQVVGTTATQTISGKTLTAPKFVDNGFIADSNGNELLSFNSNASAVNYLELENGATTNPPHLRAMGDDTNIGIHLVGKGTGEVSVCDATDETKRMRFNVANNGTGIVTTIRSNSTGSSKTIDLPNRSGTLADDTDLATKASLAGSTSQAFSVSQLEVSNTDTTITRVSAGQAGIEGVRIKTTTPIVVSAASYTTDTGTSLNMDNLDMFVITGQAGALLFNAPGGTLVQGRQLIIRIKDNGTARALTWNAVFRAMGTSLPSTTVLSKTLYLGFIYNSTDTKWDLVASAQEA